MRESLLILLPPLLFVATYTEIKSRTIPNWLTLGAIICALLASFALGGTDMFMNSLLGLVIGGAVFLPFCLAGVLGGGDFKLMAAVGALVGTPSIWWVLYYTVISGGVIAIMYAVWNGHILTTSANFFRMLIGRKGTPSHGLKKQPTIPYGLAIAIGTLWAVIISTTGA
ncbi:MAG: hypothetical protein A2X48_19630 [Lentisphaerae bacterium GWF2_49_21]|nr:MAG: hypothetical protein A2X48_19630 [Lentisphaerae bacterium GWF2_49_21]